MSSEEFDTCGGANGELEWSDKRQNSGGVELAREGQVQEGDGDGELREECGVFGCVLSRAEAGLELVSVAQVIYLGLVALQHR